MACNCSGGGAPGGAAKAKSGFDFESFSGELEALQAGKYRQTQIIPIDLSQVVTDKVVQIPGGCNGLALISRYYDPETGQLYTSDTATPAYVRLNSPSSPAIGISLIAASGDTTGFVGSIGRLYVNVPTAKAGAFLYLIALQSASILTAGNVGGTAGGGYVAPTVTSGGGGGTSTSGTGVKSGTGAGTSKYIPL